MARNLESETTTDLMRVMQEAEQWKKIAHADDLTGLLNRRGLNATLNDLKKREISSLALIYFDIDDFKRLQDKPGYGHKWGDTLLITFAYCLQTSIRNTDIAARESGDEFCLVLPGAKNGDIKTILGRLWKNLDENMVPSPDEEIRIHATYGISFSPSVEFELLLAEAKRKMEKEKECRKRGR